MATTRVAIGDPECTGCARDEDHDGGAPFLSADGRVQFHLVSAEANGGTSVSVRHTAISPQVTGGEPTGPCGEGNCGIREVLDRLGDTWSVLVVVELAKGIRGFRELERAIPGISQRMLTVTTRRLQRDGLVHRLAHPTVPPQVEYTLTRIGQSFAEAIHVLADWSAEHREVMDDARRNFDRTAPAQVP